ncbi:hypothetical protein HaLaN_31671, partial [Haematococcus lacustris]
MDMRTAEAVPCGAPTCPSMRPVAGVGGSLDLCTQQGVSAGDPTVPPPAASAGTCTLDTQCSAATPICDMTQATG